MSESDDTQAASARMMQDLTLTCDPAEFRRLSMTANAPLLPAAPAAASARMMQDITLTRHLFMSANWLLLPAAPRGTTPTPTRQRKLSPVDEEVMQLAICSAAKKLINKQDAWKYAPRGFIRSLVDDANAAAGTHISITRHMVTGKAKKLREAAAAPAPESATATVPPPQPPADTTRAGAETTPVGPAPQAATMAPSTQQVAHLQAGVIQQQGHLIQHLLARLQHAESRITEQRE
jgi:hypothetical protein